MPEVEDLWKTSFFCKLFVAKMLLQASVCRGHYLQEPLICAELTSIAYSVVEDWDWIDPDAEEAQRQLAGIPLDVMRYKSLECVGQAIALLPIVSEHMPQLVTRAQEVFRRMHLADQRYEPEEDD